MILTRHLLVLATVVVIATTAAGTTGVATPASAQAAMARPPHITWNGWKGVHPGQRLSAAATALGTTPDKSCEVYWYVRSHGATLTDYLTRSRRVDLIYPTNSRVRGPLGIHDGMRVSRLRARASSAGLEVHRYYIAEGGVYGHWISNPKSGTVLEFQKWRGKVVRFGLTRNVRTAKRQLDWQGGC